MLNIKFVEVRVNANKYNAEKTLKNIKAAMEEIKKGFVYINNTAEDEEEKWVGIVFDASLSFEKVVNIMYLFTEVLDLDASLVATLKEHRQVRIM